MPRSSTYFKWKTLTEIPISSGCLAFQTILRYRSLYSYADTTQKKKYRAHNLNAMDKSFLTKNINQLADQMNVIETMFLKQQSKITKAHKLRQCWRVSLFSMEKHSIEEYLIQLDSFYYYLMTDFFLLDIAPNVVHCLSNIRAKSTQKVRKKLVQSHNIIKICHFWRYS